MNNIVLKLTSTLLISCNIFAAFGQQSKKPNVVIFLADDLGYGSVNPYGANKDIVRTPHIDDLASAGVRFTHAHTPASICSPTRYGIITGRYP